MPRLRTAVRQRPPTRQTLGHGDALACVLRFYKTYRTDVLDCCVFGSLQVERDMKADWLHRFSHRRPHEGLCRIPPVECRVELLANLHF